MVDDDLRKQINLWRDLVRQLRHQDLHAESIVLMLVDEDDFREFASSEALAAVRPINTPTNLILTRAIRRILITKLQAELAGIEERERMENLYAHQPCL